MSVRYEIPVIARLATPVVLGNLGMMSMGVVDTLVVARLGTDAIAAASLGHIWVFGTLLPASGILLGMDPIVTQAHGAGDGPRCGLALQRALVLGVPISLILLALWLSTATALVAAGQSPQLAALAHRFVMAQAWSIPAFVGTWALRQYLAGRGIVAPAMWVTWIANLVNLAGNWALVYGHLGFAPRGLEGSATATALSRAFMVAALLAWVLVARLHAGAWQPWSRAAVSLSGLREILRHGLPSGGQSALEVWGFSITGLLAGRLGAAEIAAHQIALNLASVSFMVPLGISIAAATRVGNLTGAGEEREARLAGRTALGLGAAVMTASAAAFWFGRFALPRLYGVDGEVVELVAMILPVAALFQIFDGTQVVGCGVLRGRGDTQPAFWFNLLGYYVLGLPFAYALAFGAGVGLAGLWWGLLLGLATVAILLTFRILHRH